MNQSSLFEENEQQGESLPVFRKAYVTKKGNLDFSVLEPFCKKMVFLTVNAKEEADDLQEQIEEALEFFDPTKDVFVPVGSAVASAIAGAIIQRKLLESGRSDRNYYFVALYALGKYEFWKMYTHPDTPAEKILHQ